MLAPVLLCLALQLLAAAAKPNVIVFVIDDLGWHDTSYQGASYSTPNLDQLATEGVRWVYVTKIMDPPINEHGPCITVVFRVPGITHIIMSSVHGIYVLLD